LSQKFVGLTTWKLVERLGLPKKLRPMRTCILGTLLLLALALAQGSESDPRLVRGGKVLKEGMELDAEQEQALPDTSGRFMEQ